MNQGRWPGGMVPDLADRLVLLVGDPPGDDPDWPLVHRTLADLSGFLVGLHCVRSDSSWLADAVAQLLIGVTIAGSESRLGPRRGIISDFPIFSALAAQPIHQGHHRLLRRLQALYLLAAGDRELYVVGSRYQSPLASAGRACRRVARGVLKDDRVRAAVLAASSPEVLCDSLEQFVGPNEQWSSRGDETVVRELLPLLRDVRDDRMPRFVTPGKRRRVSGRKNVQTLTETSTVEGGRTQRHRLIEDPISVERSVELRSEGLAATHETTRPSLYVASPPTRNSEFPADGLTDYQANQRLILRARAFKSGQQPVPNRTDTLHEPALLAMITLGGRWNLQDALGPDQEAEIMLAAMLLFGCEAEDLAELRVWSARTDVPGATLAAGIVLGSQEIVLPVPHVPDGWAPPAELLSGFREVHVSVCLPVPGFLPIGKGLLAHANGRAGQTLFDHREDWAGRVDDVIKRLNARYCTELTRPRVAKYLWSATHDLDGDMAEALFLSYGHRESNDPRLYYYAPTRDHLAGQYMRIWREAAEAVGIDSGIEARLTRQGGHVGSAAVPRRRSIKTTVRTLQDHVQALISGRGRRRPERWVLIHNTLTVYVVRQIQWLTGIRAVRDSIELDLYDPQSGFLGVIDKDSDDQYGARVVWLIDPLRDQIDQYLKRVESATQAIYGRSDRYGAFRFIDPYTLEIQPNDLRRLKAYSPGYPYAPNAHRHYIRTRLRELGVDAGFVDAWLGHGGIGREPYARHSALAPNMMRQAVQPALMTIWNELGWKVLPSQ